MKLFGYIDDLVNRFIVPLAERLPIWVNLVILFVIGIILSYLYEMCKEKGR